MPAVQENTAGGDQGPAPPEGGWADRIRVHCLLLHDECDLAGERANRNLTPWPSSSPTSAPDVAGSSVGVVYELGCLPAARVTPEPLASEMLAKLAEANEAARAPDVQGARISRSRGRLPPASRAVQHRDRERTLGQDGCGVAEDGSGRRYLGSIGCGTMIGIQRGR